MKSKLGLVTGSFDPITVGHLDIIIRAKRIFDRVIVVVAHNEEKNYTFSPAERVFIAEKSVKSIDGVSVELCDGMVADFAVSHNADAFVRGIRGEADVAYEQNMAEINLKNSGLDTVMLFSNPRFHGISSTKVREKLKNNDSIEGLVPENAISDVIRIFNSKG